MTVRFSSMTGLVAKMGERLLQRNTATSTNLKAG
jgi:hypothetical protein